MRIQYSKILLLSLSLFLIFEGLDAYSVGNIPIYWIGVSFLVFIYLAIYLTGFRATSYNFVSIRNWVAYGIIITLIQSLFNDIVLPRYASTSYFQYISLRILRLLVFILIIYTLNYISKKNIKKHELR